MGVVLQELNEAEQSLRIARNQLDTNPAGEIASAVVSRAREAMRLALAAMLESFGLPADPDQLNEHVRVELTKRGALNEDWVVFFYDLQAQDMRVTYGFELRVSPKAIRDILARTEQFVSDARRSVEAVTAFHEHDVVRVRDNVESEGYQVRKGMIGTIVSVYGSGEALAVEFPDLDNGPAVVTLKTTSIEATPKS